MLGQIFPFILALVISLIGAAFYYASKEDTGEIPDKN